MLSAPGSDKSFLHQWMFSPTLQEDGQLILMQDSPRATLKTVSFFNAYCTGLQTNFVPGDTGGGSLQLSLQISPQRIAVGAIVHDNNWPLVSHGAGETFAEIPTAPIPRGKSKADEEPGLFSTIVHSALDVAGLIPVIGELADGANALYYLAEGNKTDAALSAAAMIPVAGMAATGVKLLRKGSKTLKTVLKNADSITKADILKDVQRNFPSLKLKGKSPDGRFHEFVDSRGTTRLKVHPPDKVTPYDHIHIYNRRGQPLDANLKVSDVKSSDVHIKIKP